VPWIAERRQFECPCHASVFDITGTVVKAPAPRALDLFVVSFKRDRVMVDISRPVRRSVFSAEQAVHPSELG
jgi:cytochrome b6-f complex iron-sulfur subunit